MFNGDTSLPREWRVEWSEGWSMLIRVFVNGGCYSVGLQVMLSMH